MPAYFWPHRGGIETITRSLAKEWTALGHTVHVVTSSIDTRKKNEIYEGVTITRTGKHAFFRCPLAPGAFFAPLKQKPDIVYLHYPHPLFLDMGVWGSLFARIPYVLHVHGPEITYDDWKEFPISVYNKTAFHFALAHAAAIVSHTEAAVDASPLLQKYHQKIAILPHGTEVPQLPNKNIQIMNEITNEKIILFMGMLRDYKRVDLLLRAFVFVRHQIPHAKLVIVGDGPMRGAWEKLTYDLGLRGRVLFCGRVTEQEKWTYYHAADLFVLPSPTLMESFGTVAFEAALCKKPVIVSGAGVAEVFRKEKIGVIVEPYNVQALAEAMVDLLLHPTKAKRLGYATARVITQKYLWKDRAQAYLSLFEQVRDGIQH